MFYTHHQTEATWGNNIMRRLFTAWHCDDPARACELLRLLGRRLAIKRHNRGTLETIAQVRLSTASNEDLRGPRFARSARLSQLEKCIPMEF